MQKKVMCQVMVRSVKESLEWSYDSCTTCQDEVDMSNGKYKC